MSKPNTTDRKDGGPRELLRDWFAAAVAAADPMTCVPPAVPTPDSAGRVVVVGAGKASAAMALAVECEAERHGWHDRLEGLVVTRYGHGASCDRIEIIEAAHPVPDVAGATAAQRIQALASDLTSDDMLFCLISGGGSALLAAPADGISADDKASVTRALLRSGAPIGEMNCVRKHISAVKGGRLARSAAPARVLSLIISDVPGDDPSVIASGPTVPDPTTRQEALEILTRYEIDAPASVTALLNSPAGETPKPDDPLFANVDNVIIARPSGMLAATETAARMAGCNVVSLGADLEGEARELGALHAAQALRLQKERAGDLPLVILSGGETTVTVSGKGRGGRNAEYALGLAMALAGAPDIYGIACDTDGIDGVEDNAGVLVTPDTLERARAAGFDAVKTLARNDAYSLFAAIDDLVMTGPTRTNVNDFRAILIT